MPGGSKISYPTTYVDFYLSCCTRAGKYAVSLDQLYHLPGQPFHLTEDRRVKKPSVRYAGLIGTMVCAPFQYCWDH